MDNFEVVTKKSLKTRVIEWFTSFISLFIKKEKCLGEASQETTKQLEEVNLNYDKLKEDETFEGLKDTYDKYKIGVNPLGGLIAVEKNTGYVKEEPDFVAKVRFATLWRKSAFANLDMKDEEKCLEECFSNDSHGIYAELKEDIQNQLVETGNIDTFKLLNKMKESNYKWGRVTSRRLFKTNASADTVVDYFRTITPNSKKQTKPTDSLQQAIYGVEISE